MMRYTTRLTCICSPDAFPCGLCSVGTAPRRTAASPHSTLPSTLHLQKDRKKPALYTPTFWFLGHRQAMFQKPNSITLAGSKLVRSWFGARSGLVRSWSSTSFEPVCDQLRTSFEPASVMEFGFTAETRERRL